MHRLLVPFFAFALMACDTQKVVPPTDPPIKTEPADDLPEPSEGGTCASMGGVTCECPDGTTACTNVREDECNCEGGPIPWPDVGEAVKPKPPPEKLIEEPGGCMSMGKEDCVCPNGGKSCTNTERDACICGGEAIPWPSVSN